MIIVGIVSPHILLHYWNLFDYTALDDHETNERSRAPQMKMKERGNDLKLRHIYVHYLSIGDRSGRILINRTQWQNDEQVSLRPQFSG
jgi:hypothetical protein